MNLHSKIIALLIPVILLPLLSLSFLVYEHLLSTNAEKVFDEINDIITRIDNSFENKLRTTVSNINLLSTNNLLIQYVLTEDEESRYNILQRPLHKLISTYQNEYPEYYEIRIIMPDGYEDFRSTIDDIPNITEEESSNPFIEKILNQNQEFIHGVELNPDNNTFSLYASKRLVLKNKAEDTVFVAPSLRAFLVTTISLDYLYGLLETNQIGSKSVLFITDKLGNILYYTPSQYIEQFRINKEANSGITLPETLFAQMTTVLHKNEIISSNIFEPDSYLRGARLGEHLYLYVWLPEEELLVDTYWIKTIVPIITLATILLTITLIFLALKFYIINPISKLETAAKAIGHGHLENEISISSQDEIGSLARNIQQMCDNLKTTNERIRYIAYHDSLTGLPNRLMFREYLGRAIASAKRNNETLALLFLDLDNFKWINDTLGHDTGDELLKDVSVRIENVLRETDYIAQINSDHADDVVARLGGDEFIILLTNLHDDFAPAHIASRIIDSLKKPVTIDKQEVYAGASIGITLYPQDSEDPDSLIKNADMAMYHAKKQGKNNFQHFSEALNIASTRRLTLENQLRKAINDNKLTIAYQPQIEAKTSKVIAVEALARWNDDEHGEISPTEFIPVAEDSGLIFQLGEWVINEVCRQIKEWGDSGLPEITVAINISTAHFARQELPEIISQALKKHSVAPSLLEIELTESIFMNDEKHASEMLFNIRSMGVKVSLDDFGTGYSSLSYLRKFPIDNLKIDRSFISEISYSREGEEVITAIIRMAHAMHLKVIAEGVETKTQLSFLCEKECDYIQGFYYFQPIPANEVSSVLYKQQIDAYSGPS